MTSERTAAPPMHRQIRQALADEIAAGTWQVGESWPSEPHLAERFGVSRMTVRQALGDLAAQGLIVRRHGRATRVAAPPLEQALGPGRLYAFASEMARRGLPHHSRVLEVGLVTASHAAQAALGLGPGGQVARITLLRLLGDEALMHESAALVPELLPWLRDQQVTARSLYDVLETGAGIVVTRAVESIRPAALSRRMARQLGVPERAPAFAVTRTSFAALDGGEYPFEWRESFVRGDRYRFVAELRRELLTSEAP